MADITEYIRINRINADIERGGWQCQFDVMRDTDLLETNQRVDITWRGIFGDTPPGMIRQAFSGYVLPSRHEFNVSASRTSYVAETTDGFLRRGWLQGIGFAEVDARANYHQFSDDDSECPAEDMGYEMTLGKLVKHIMGYYDSCVDLGPEWIAHTNHVFHPIQNPNGWITLDNVTTDPWSVGNPDGSMVTSAYICRETDNLWSRLVEIARNEFFTIYFDKADHLYYTKHPMYLAGALPTPVMTFDEDFMMGPMIVTPIGPHRARQVILHAVTDEEDTLDSEYPDSPTFVYGRVEERSRVRCNDQDTLDEWAERLYLYMSRDYTVQVTCAGLVGLLFELLDRVQITYTGTTANGVHIDWTEKKFWIHQIDIVPDAAFGGITTFTLEAENV